MERKYIFSLLIWLTTTLAHAQEQPNMLWVVIEDTSPQYIGCYGNAAAHTPQIDRLAIEGVRFKNAYSTGTICSPSRSAIITGVSTSKMGTGHHRSRLPIPDFIKGFPYYLRQAGYYTSNNSKTDYNTANAREIIRNSWDESSGKAGWWNRKPGQPFFAVFNFGDSHQSRTMTNPYALYKKQVLKPLPDALEIGDDEFEMPPFYRDSPEMRKQVARVYNGIALADYKIGLLLDRLKKEGLADSTIIFFYSDHGQGMPRAKANGIGQGYRVPFVIWFPDAYKHLSPWGTGGVVTNEHISFADLGPTVLSLAGVEAPPYMDGRAFLGEKREDAPEYIYTSNDRGEDSPSLDRSVIKNNLIYTRSFTPYSNPFRWIHYFNFGEISQVIVDDFRMGKLSEEQEMLLDPRSPEYLYDLSADPWEMNNLVNDPAYRKEVAKMKKALEKHILAGKDVMFVPEYELKQLPESVTPYEFRLSPTYDIKNVWKSAKLSGLRSEKSKKKQIQLLAHKNDLVRYWAAVGLKSQESFSPENIRNIELYLNDAYPPVQVYLASVVYDQNKSMAAQKVIEKYALSADADLSLLALHNIHHMRRKEDFIELINRVYENVKDEKGMRLPRQCAEVLLYRLEGRPLKMEHFW